MRILRLLLLLAYIAGHAGLPLPMPDGGQLAGACGCGDSCQCSPARKTAGNCCCAVKSAPAGKTGSGSCCQAKRSSCCSGKPDDGNDDPPVLPVFSSCGCQQPGPAGVLACSDPRLPHASVTTPDFRVCDWSVPAVEPGSPLVFQSPDDPVPRLMV